METDIHGTRPAYDGTLDASISSRFLALEVLDINLRILKRRLKAKVIRRASRFLALAVLSINLRLNLMQRKIPPRK